MPITFNFGYQIAIGYCFGDDKGMKTLKTKTCLVEKTEIKI